MRKIVSTVIQLMFSLLDKIMPKTSDVWVFGIGKNHRLNGNLRFFYDYCTGNGLRTIVVSYDQNDEYLYVKSAKAMNLVLRAGVVIVQYKVRDIYWNLSPSNKRIVVNLWHSTTIKGFHNLNEHLPETKDRIRALRKETDVTSYYISSSKTDRTAMAAAYGVPLSRILLTGLPRNDYFEMTNPSPDLNYQENMLLRIKEGKKLVLYAPTFRDSKSGAYIFSAQEINSLNKLASLHNFIFAIRSHPGIMDAKQDDFLFLDSESYPEAQVLLKHADLLISDYSGIWVDFLLLNRPVIGFLYDLQSYESSVSSVIYDLEKFFPGQIAKDFSSLLKSIDSVMQTESEIMSNEERVKRQLYQCYTNEYSKRLLGQLIGTDNNNI